MSALNWMVFLAVIGISGWAIYRLPAFLEIKINGVGKEKTITWRLALIRLNWTVIHSVWTRREMAWQQKIVGGNYFYALEPWVKGIFRTARLLKMRIELRGGWPEAPHLTGIAAGLVCAGLGMLNRLIPRLFAPTSCRAELSFQPDFQNGQWQFGFWCILNLSCGHIINAAGKSLWRLWKSKKGGTADGRPASH